VAVGGVRVAVWTIDPHEGEAMSILDKLTGRAKQAVGDLTGDKGLRRKGRREERKGEAKEELERDQRRTAAKAKEVSDLERKT
jgi:uncharacterized protein YjbJ (UPF0337 family)